MIRSSTLQFLEDLSANNNREWFQQNKSRYQHAREDVIVFAQSAIKSLSAIDRSVPADLNPEDCVMRIYRDIRFSKDKTPYKTNFAIAISERGKNFDGPGYYIHIAPGNSFIGGGAWYPEKEKLKAIRQEIDYNGDEFLEIIKSSDFTTHFGDLDMEGKLRTAPKGYPSDHPMIEFLKLKSFVAARAISDEELQDKNLERNVTDTFAKLYPLIVFLRNAIS